LNFGIKFLLGLQAGINTKSLSGIETPKRPWERGRRNAANAGINLNPYQGLKRATGEKVQNPTCRNQPKSLSGIETFAAQ
jgi:hypothetical protein